MTLRLRSCPCRCVALFVCLSLAACSSECVSSACALCAVLIDRYLPLPLQLLLRGGSLLLAGLPAVQPDSRPCFVSCRRVRVSTPPRSSSTIKVASHAAYKTRLRRSSQRAPAAGPASTLNVHRLSMNDSLAAHAHTYTIDGHTAARVHQWTPLSCYRTATATTTELHKNFRPYSKIFYSYSCTTKGWTFK